MLSQLALSQYKPIFVNTEAELKPFVGTWQANNNGFTYTIFFIAKKIENGGKHAVGKYVLKGDYLVQAEQNNVLVDTRTHPILFEDYRTMGAFKIDSDFRTNYLNMNDVSNSYFISFRDSKKCNTRITSQITILPNDTDRMFWVSEISLPSTMDDEGIKILSKNQEQQELELYGCNRVKNRDQMTIPGNLTFYRVK